ncbi:MAG: ABC transporter permease [Bacteroidota bacterium]
MFKHNLKIALRNIIKYWNYTIINIGGLAIGLASFIFIILYVNDELKYDRHHEKSDRIFRVNRLYNNNDVDEDAATVSFPCGPTLVNDYPEIVEKQVRFFNQFRNQWFFEYQKSDDEVIKYNEPYFIMADSTVFDVFTIPFIEGDPETALDNPNTIVVTESTAMRYFGGESALNKVLRLEEGVNFTITGVIEDLPQQSHLKIDILGSLNTFRQFNRNGRFPETWIWNPCWTYVLLHEEISPAILDEKFPDFYNNHYNDLQEADVTLSLTSLKDIHLKSHHVYEMRANGNEVYVYTLSIIAMVIIALACINFTNLATASSASRAKEIGIKKVFGSMRRKLALQFIGEAVIQSLIAMLLALLVVELLLPAFNSFAGKRIPSNFLFEVEAIGFFIAVTLVVGIIAGAYPAIILSSFKPISVLQGTLRSGAKSGVARKILVIFQFSISIGLIISSLVVFYQLEFLRNADLGFKKDHIINIQRVGPLFNQYSTFKQKLLSHKDIKYVTGAEDYLGINHNTRDYEIEGLEVGQRFYIPTFLVDWDFVEAFDIKVVEGRAFSTDFPGDTVNAVMINETMAKDLGWSNEEAIGKRIKSRDGDERVIGVFGDFNAMSLHRPRNKFILDMFRRPEVFAQVISIRFSSENYQEVIKHIEETWNEFVPTRPFEYHFFDQQLADLYSDELRFGRFSLLLTILAIIIASMGLIGLTSFMAEQRTKEIGIRRALGSSIGSIIGIMSKEFFWLLLLANIIAWPITYYFTTDWLQSYSRHVSTIWEIYFISGAIALAIAMGIIFYRAYKTAVLNPAKTLRYE